MIADERAEEMAYLLDCWKSVTANDTRPYGYELFVRLEKLISKDPAKYANGSPQDEFGLIPRIIGHLKQNASGYKLFCSLWDETRQKLKP